MSKYKFWHFCRTVQTSCGFNGKSYLHEWNNAFVKKLLDSIFNNFDYADYYRSFLQNCHVRAYNKTLAKTNFAADGPR